MDSINRLLTWLNENWSAIVICAGLVIALYEKIKAYLSKSKEEKIAAAKAQLSEVILKLVTDAEEEYEDYNKAGSIKRSEVLSIIYEKFPVLAKVISQDELTKWIDEQIDEALDKMRDILNESSEAETPVEYTDDMQEDSTDDNTETEQ